MLDVYYYVVKYVPNIQIYQWQKTSKFNFINLQPDRLVANDFIQCRKVAEHILEKLLGDCTASSPGCGDADSNAPSNNGYNVDQIELTCNEQVSSW